MRALMLFLLSVCPFSTIHAEEFSAKIIAVLDGDTVLIKRASGLVKIRLADIDAPEVSHAGMDGQPPSSQKAQTFGETSRRSLSDMVLGKQVKVDSQATDQYGRMVAHLSVNGMDVNTEQIRRGMAWEYSHFHSNQELIALQEEARQAQRGLWAQGNPIPPWDWRKQHPGALPAPSKVAALPAAASTAATPLDPACGNKKHCREMASCDEARFYLTRCGVKSLDGNHNGMPCDELCSSQKK